MAEAKVAPKKYVSDKPTLSVVLILADGKSDSISFERGELISVLASEQEAIEACELFRSGHVRLAPPVPSPREALVAAVKDANAKSASANAALNEFDKANPPATAAK